ncbi:DotD/TraH family lipoprotein [Enterobacteriaceae bacterium H11S18]|uniref:DotD/TraH family lipoprotein n=1 Tax=Dryocola clanedunensis TaxID=2925396 RepID=UPI0022F12350|nr:DotD/TraH family lipoprotein [Dryocola clanedunensis]MCT4709269.1 DotD/TraH family lipoprotein [Dryocola clanedunensis]
MVNKPVLSMLLPLLLTGCQALTCLSPAPVLPKPAPVKPTPVQQLAATQQAMALGGALSAAVPVPSFSRITTNSQRVTLDWDGDAIELLAWLAHQRGLSMSWNGTRLPLPVNIHEKNVTFNTLLRIISTQTDWRARIEQRPDSLRVYFMLPLKGRVT